MNTPALRTIVSEDWRAMFARHRAEGAREGNVMLAQIRAAMRREELSTAVGCKRGTGVVVTGSGGRPAGAVYEADGGALSPEGPLPNGSNSRHRKPYGGLSRNDTGEHSFTACDCAVRVGGGLVQRTVDEGASGLRLPQDNMPPSRATMNGCESRGGSNFPVPVPAETPSIFGRAEVSRRSASEARYALNGSEVLERDGARGGENNSTSGADVAAA